MMEQILEREESIRKYLLGELAEDERADVELRLLDDDDYFSELLLIENELTDDFVFGTLPDREEERIQSHFLSIPQRQEKLAIAMAFGRYLAVCGPTEPSDISWENALAEAQENRYLLSALMDEDWTGLRLLALLRVSSKDKSELAARVQADDTVITSIIIRLIECGVVEEQGDVFFCARLGIETLAKFEQASGVKIAF